MALSHLPAFVDSFFLDLARWLDKRSASRVPSLLLGMLLATYRPAGGVIRVGAEQRDPALLLLDQHHPEATTSPSLGRWLASPA